MNSTPCSLTAAKVVFIGAGPGEADLITVRGSRLLGQAQVVLFDALADQDAHELAVNEIGTVQIQTQQPLPVEAYVDNRVGGALIVVDPTTNRTSGALLVKAA